MEKKFDQVLPPCSSQNNQLLCGISNYTLQKKEPYTYTGHVNVSKIVFVLTSVQILLVNECLLTSGKILYADHDWVADVGSDEFVWING